MSHSDDEEFDRRFQALIRAEFGDVAGDVDQGILQRGEIVNADLAITTEKTGNRLGDAFEIVEKGRVFREER